MGKVFEQVFDSFEALAEQSAKAPLWDRDHCPRYRADKGFYGVPLDEAVKMAQTGWTEGRELLEDAMGAARGAASMMPLPSRVFDVAGDRPSPARAAAGDPFCMTHKGRSRKSRERVIRIAVQCSVMHYITQGQIMRYGAALLTVIDAIETAGIRVELTGYWQSRDGDLIRTIATLKPAHEPVDIDRLAFVLAHPSATRRCVWGIREQTPVCSSYRQSVGSTVSGRPDNLDDDVFWLKGANSAEADSTEEAFEKLFAQFRENGQRGADLVHSLDVKIKEAA